MDSQQDSKPLSASKGIHENIFFHVYKSIFIYFSSLSHLSVYFFPSQQPLTPSLNPVDETAVIPPRSFNTTAAENQTLLKQIDVPFHIVVTSSHGPRVSALVTTAGLLS
ncbi:hypothetical protein AMECASPLE_038500 [Ameca splendens]|uniref:Uncharacterized protein n=1 Tax=Ameca splendens TaxID=208324 RepID=A0ABV0Y8I2_9TELE